MDWRGVGKIAGCLTDPNRLGKTAIVKRVLIFGRGASGKSTLAARLGEITALPVIELDKIFWQRSLVATPHDQWDQVQIEPIDFRVRQQYPASRRHTQSPKVVHC